MTKRNRDSLSEPAVLRSDCLTLHSVRNRTTRRKISALPAGGDFAVFGDFASEVAELYKSHVANDAVSGEPHLKILATRKAAIKEVCSQLGHLVLHPVSHFFDFYSSFPSSDHKESLSPPSSGLLPSIDRQHQRSLLMESLNEIESESEEENWWLIERKSKKPRIEEREVREIRIYIETSPDGPWGDPFYDFSNTSDKSNISNNSNNFNKSNKSNKAEVAEMVDTKESQKSHKSDPLMLVRPDRISTSLSFEAVEYLNKTQPWMDFALLDNLNYLTLLDKKVLAQAKKAQHEFEWTRKKAELEAKTEGRLVQSAVRAEVWGDHRTRNPVRVGVTSRFFEGLDLTGLEEGGVKWKEIEWANVRKDLVKVGDEDVVRELPCHRQRQQCDDGGQEDDLGEEEEYIDPFDYEEEEQGPELRYLPIKMYFPMLREFILVRGREFYEKELDLPMTCTEDIGDLYFWSCKLGYRDLFDKLSLQEAGLVRVPWKHWVFERCAEKGDRDKVAWDARKKEGRNTGVDVGNGSAAKMVKGVVEKAKRDMGCMEGMRYVRIPEDVDKMLSKGENKKLRKAHEGKPNWNYEEFEDLDGMEIVKNLWQWDGL